MLHPGKSLNVLFESVSLDGQKSEREFRLCCSDINKKRLLKGDGSKPDKNLKTRTEHDRRLFFVQFSMYTCGLSQVTSGVIWRLTAKLWLTAGEVSEVCCKVTKGFSRNTCFSFLMMPRLWESFSSTAWMWFRKERFSSRSTPSYIAKPVSGRLIVPLEVIIPVISRWIVPILEKNSTHDLSTFITNRFASIQT